MHLDKLLSSYHRYRENTCNASCDLLMTKRDLLMTKRKSHGHKRGHNPFVL